MIYAVQTNQFIIYPKCGVVSFISSFFHCYAHVEFLTVPAYLYSSVSKSRRAISPFFHPIDFKPWHNVP